MPKQARQGIQVEENTKLKRNGRWLLYVDGEIILEASRESTIRYLAGQMEKRIAEQAK